MTAYIVATVMITNPEVFAEYSKMIAGLSERFGGQPVVRGAVSEILEGEGTVGERVVITRFETADTARAYIQSPEYRAGSAKRIGAATVTMRLIEVSA